MPVRCIKLFLVMSCLGVGHRLNAQHQNVLGFEGSFHRVEIVRHTRSMRISTGERIWAGDFGLRWQTRGNKPWHAWHRFPAYGVSFCIFPNGPDAHGTVIGALPYMQLPVLRLSPVQFNLRVGTGLCYVTAPFDPEKNPEQNAIGSSINNITQFRLGFELPYSTQGYLQAGASFTHVSNGSSRMPNLGINQPGYFIQMAWMLKPTPEHTFVDAVPDALLPKRWGGLVNGGMAFSQYKTFQGAIYMTTFVGAMAQYTLNHTNRLTFGVDNEYFALAYHEGIKEEGKTDQKQARSSATRISLTAGDEMQFGDVSLHVLFGVYVGEQAHRISTYTNASWYNRLSARYYIIYPELEPVNPYFGVTLKAHRSVAEFVALECGVRF